MEDSRPPYFLSESTYVAIHENGAVFLDLKRDKYWSVEADDVPALRASVRGWPVANDATLIKDSCVTTNGQEIVRLLLDVGVLTVDARLGKNAMPIDVPRITATIDWIQGAVWERRFPDLLRFVWAWLVGQLSMKLPIRCVLLRLSRRKRRVASRMNPFDSKKVSTLVDIFRLLRPFFYSEKDACLKDSLIFVEYMALYGVYPTLVIGVTNEPFKAHCWVQEGEMVLNDTIRHVAQFSPIMIV